MNRLEEMKKRFSSQARFGQLGASLGAVILLAGCPGGENGPADLSAPDLASPSDMAMVKVQQPGCSPDDWCWQFPQPQGNTLWGAWGASASDIWAVGDAGAILHYTNGQWKPIISPTKNALYTVWGSSATDVYAAGDLGTVLHYDGKDWKPETITGNTTSVGAIYAIWGNSKDNVWMVGAGGTILRKEAGTLKREVLPNKPGFNVVLNGVWGVDNKVFGVGAQGWFVAWDGTKWDAAQIPDVRAQADHMTSIVGVDAGHFYVGARSGAVWRFQNNAWTTVAPFGDYGIYTLLMQGADIFAAGDVLYYDKVNKDATKRRGIVKKLTAGMFTDVAGTLPVSVFGGFSSGTDIILVGASGTILRYNGTKFESTSPIDRLTGVGGPLVGIAGDSEQNLTAVGDWGTTLRWDGTNWGPQLSSDYVRFRSVSGTSNNLWAVAYDATPMLGKPLIYKYLGGNWMSVPFTGMSELVSIWTSGQDGLAAGHSEVLFRRVGDTWTAVSVNNKNNTSLRGIWGTDASSAWIVGGGDVNNQNPGLSMTSAGMYPGKILFYNGTDAKPVAGLPATVTGTPATNTLHAIHGTSKSSVWAVGDGGAILFHDGATWVQQASRTLVSLRGIWAVSNKEVYAVGEGGTLLRYDGADWKSQDSGTSNTLLGVIGVGKQVYTVGSSGTVLRKVSP